MTEIATETANVSATAAVSATVIEIHTVVARISLTSREDLLFSRMDRRSINGGAPGTTVAASLDPGVVAALLKVLLATLQPAPVLVPGSRLLVAVLREGSDLWVAESAAALVMIFKRHLLLCLVRNEASLSPAVETLLNLMMSEVMLHQEILSNFLSDLFPGQQLKKIFGHCLRVKERS